MRSPDAERIREWLFENVKTARSETLEEARRQGEARAAQTPLAPGTKLETVTAGGVPAEWVTAARAKTAAVSGASTSDVAAATALADTAATSDTVILHLHGGGYTMGSLATARGLASLLSSYAGVPVLSVGYRLAPENPFPAALDDALAAYSWLLAEGHEPDTIILAGDSAGGGLALATMLSLRNRGLPLPAGAALISPWVDLTGSGASVTTCAENDPFLDPEGLHCEAARYAGDADLRHPLLSPLFADLSGLPPLLIHVGTDDILLDDSRRLAERAKEAGVDVTLKVWEGMWHVWHEFALQVPEASEALEDIGAFVRSAGASGTAGDPS